MNWYQKRKLRAMSPEEAEAAVKEQILQDRMREVRYRVLKQFRDLGSEATTKARALDE